MSRALLLAILFSGCATPKPKATRTAYIEFHGLKIAYEIPADKGLKK